MKRVPVLLAALTLAMTSACGGLTEQTTEGSSFSDVDPATLGGQQVVDELQQLYDAAQEAGEDTVVIYGATANERAELYDLFAQRFPGIRVEAEFLTGPQLTSRVNQEVASGNRFADITHTGSTTQVGFADADRFEPFEPVSAEELDDRFRDPQNRIISDAAAISGIMYNTDLVDPADAPRSWDDLLDPRWRGQIAIGDPTSSGAYSGAFGRMLFDDRYDRQYFERLAEQGQVLDSTQVSNAIISGEYAIAPAFPHVTYQGDREEGAPIDFAFPLEGGNRESPHYLGLLRGSPHPNAARLLITWLFTPEAQEAIAQTGDYPTMPGAPAPEEFPPLAELDLLAPIPLAEDAEVYGDAIETFQEIFR